MSNSHSYVTIYCSNCYHTFRVPVSCEDRFCGVCNQTRRSKVRHRLDLLSKHRSVTSDGEIRFLTLTIRNMPDLEKMVKVLLSSFRRLRQRKFWQKKVSGGAFVIEVTKPNDSWHAHLHIVMQGYYFPYEVLLEMWKEVSPGQGVFIKMIPADMIVRYLTKYLSKPSSLKTSADTRFANQVLKGTRLFQPFGSWFGISNQLPKFKPKCPKCDTSGCYMHEYDVLGMHGDFERKLARDRGPPFVPSERSNLYNQQ